MNKHLFIFLVAICFALPICAQKVVNICGEADYYVPESMSVAEAKMAAIRLARNNALEKEFGISISHRQKLISTEQGVDNNTYYFSQSESELKGLWLADTKEPEINIEYKNNEMVIHAKVCGKAREQKTSQTELQVDVLNNGNKSTNFTDGDKLSIKFKSSVKGYVAIFITDVDKNTVYCMMPYDTENSSGYAREVKNNRDYIFLSTQDPEYPYAEETIMVTDKTSEVNNLLVVFSEKSFRLSLNNKGEFVPEVALNKFQKWLDGLRVYDATVQVEEIILTIKQ